MPTITIEPTPETKKRMENIAEALLVNEKLRRRAPEGWDSTEIIKNWRRDRITP